MTSILERLFGKPEVQVSDQTPSSTVTVSKRIVSKQIVSKRNTLRNQYTLEQVDVIEKEIIAAYEAFGLVLTPEERRAVRIEAIRDGFVWEFEFGDDQ